MATPLSKYSRAYNWDKNSWGGGTRFSINTKTRYEQLPEGHEGHFEIVNTGHFDGEKFWTGSESPAAHCIQYDSEYTILNKIVSFSKAELDRYLKEGYLHIKKSSEDNI